MATNAVTSLKNPDGSKPVQEDALQHRAPFRRVKSTAYLLAPLGRLVIV